MTQSQWHITAPLSQLQDWHSGTWVPQSSMQMRTQPRAQMKSRCRRRISLRHTGQRERRRLHLRHMQAWPQGISATCTARTMHTLQSLPGTPGGPSPFSWRLRPAASSCLSGMSKMVSPALPAEGTRFRQQSCPVGYRQPHQPSQVILMHGSRAPPHLRCLGDCWLARQPHARLPLSPVQRSFAVYGQPLSALPGQQGGGAPLAAEAAQQGEQRLERCCMAQQGLGCCCETRPQLRRCSADSVTPYSPGQLLTLHRRLLVQLQRPQQQQLQERSARSTGLLSRI